MDILDTPPQETTGTRESDALIRNTTRPDWQTYREQPCLTPCDCMILHHRYNRRPLSELSSHFAPQKAGRRVPPKPLSAQSRSEERRVGKEWRSRWSPYH